VLRRFLQKALAPIILAAGVFGLGLLPIRCYSASVVQSQRGSILPADGFGQSVVAEFAGPLEVEFSAYSIARSAPESSSPLTARVYIPSDPGSEGTAAPVGVDSDSNLVTVNIRNNLVEPGALVGVVIADPGHTIWLWATEHDSYAGGARLHHGEAVGGDLSFQVINHRTLFDILGDGIAVALESSRVMLAVAAIMLVAGLLVSRLLARRYSLDSASLSSAGVGGGLLLAVLAGWPIVALPKSALAPTITALVCIAGLVTLILWWRMCEWPLRVQSSSLGLLCALGILILIHLADVADLSIPLHTDSMEHFLIVGDLLSGDTPGLAFHQVGEILTRYYHYGFHIFQAWVMSLAQASGPTALLVTGQILQATAAITLYFPVYVATRDPSAAAAAVIVAGFGWTMPGYATNWGKYPAILGLAVFPFLAGTTLLALVTHRARARRLLLLLAVAVPAAVIVHTRLLAVFAAFVAALGIALASWPSMLDRIGPVRRLLPLLPTLAVPFAVLCGRGEALSALRDAIAPYCEGHGVVTSLAVIALLPSAFRHYRTQTWAGLGLLSFLLVLRIISFDAPAPWPLLDGPMVKMTLYLPLSLLGGLGVSAVPRDLPRRATPFIARQLRLPWAAPVVLVAIAWTIAPPQSGPPDWAMLARADDTRAALWASATMPSDSLVLIPSYPSNLPYPAAIDGGGWLPALAHLSTVRWPADVSLSTAEASVALCDLGVSHVYVGGTAQSFVREELDLAPVMYSPVFTTPGVAIYALESCHSQ
jgi:hypothetical protein